MTKRLAGRVALVTGGSRGLGAGIARRLAREGAVVAVNYNRNPDAAASVVDEISEAGGQAASFAAAIDDPDSVDSMIEAIGHEFGSVDLLVSNAGTASRGQSILDSEFDEFRRLMNVHALGPLHLIRRLLPQMRARGRANIIAISSATVNDSPAKSAPYTMAKAALETAAFTLAREERHHGIRVNIVAPGLVDTDMGARLVRAVRAGEITDLQSEFPFGRVCQPDDVAGLVTFLASEDGDYITGQRLTVDGGGSEPAIF